MRSIGIILAILGILGLIYGGFSYTKQRKILDVGPITTKVDDKKTVPIPPLVGVVFLVGGVALIAADRKPAA